MHLDLRANGRTTVKNRSGEREDEQGQPVQSSQRATGWTGLLGEWGGGAKCRVNEPQRGPDGEAQRGGAKKHGPAEDKLPCTAAK